MHSFLVCLFAKGVASICKVASRPRPINQQDYQSFVVRTAVLTQ